MLYALSWFLVLSLLGLWSLTVWGLQAMLGWALAHAGAVGGAAAGIEGLPLPAWLSPWLPPELVQAASGWLAALGPLVDSLMQSLPAVLSGLSGGVSVVAWLIWGVGAFLLLLLGVGAHGLIALWRRRSRHRTNPMTPMVRISDHG